VVVLGASPDSPKDEKKFQEKENIPFPLLADEDRKLATAYDVLKEKSMYGRKFLAVQRTTFLIGADGRIAQIFDRVKPEGHAAEVLAALGK
jgi:peroxiredoxin Q/BCP